MPPSLCYRCTDANDIEVLLLNSINQKNNIIDKDNNDDDIFLI